MKQAGRSHSPQESRLEKFRRVLAKLVLDRPVFVRCQPIAVHLDSPLDELCDVTLRLTHKSGRIYAEARVQLDAQTRTIPLGTALNLPDGAYDVIASPPLAEFFSTTPYERRLPCTVAALPFATTPAGSYAERRAEMLDEIAARGEGPAAGTARSAKAAGGESGPHLTEILDLVSERDPTGLAAAVLGYSGMRGGRQRLAARIAHVGTDGFDLSETGVEATIVALAALVESGDDQLAELSVAVMDKLVFCLALNFAGGAYAGARTALSPTGRMEVFSPLARLLFGVGAVGENIAAPLALALAARYEPPPLLQRIALDEAEGVSMQRHRPPGGDRTTLYRTWRSAGASLSSTSDGSWLAGLSVDARVFVAARACAITHRDGSLVARYDETAAGMLTIAFPFWAFEETAREADWAFGKLGSTYVALHAARGLSAPREYHAASLESPAAGNLLACHIGSAAADSDFASFRERVMAARPAPSEPDADSATAHIDSAYCTVDPGATDMEIRFGEDGMRLDFSLLATQEDRTNPS